MKSLWSIERMMFARATKLHAGHGFKYDFSASPNIWCKTNSKLMLFAVGISNRNKNSMSTNMSMSKSKTNSQFTKPNSLTRKQTIASDHIVQCGRSSNGVVNIRCSAWFLSISASMHICIWCCWLWLVFYVCMLVWVAKKP